MSKNSDESYATAKRKLIKVTGGEEK